MSETTSAPVAGGDGASAPPSAPETRPAPDTQPEISISDAARMLRAQRRAAQQQAQGEAPAGIGHNSGEAPPPAPAAPPEARPSGVAALEAALGLDPSNPPSAPADAPVAAPPAEIELEGRRWTHEQLRSALSMAQDYTQKTQALAEQARQLQMQQQAFAAVLPHIAPELEALQRRMADAPRPDPALRQTDPATYWDQVANWQDAQMEQQRIQALQAMQQQARDAAMAQAVAQANQVLAQKYPFWGDPQQRREIQTDLVAWARTQGYTDQELDSLTNPRYLETLMKARFYDKHFASVATRAPTPSVQAAPQRGAAPPPAPTARLNQANEAFQAKPNIANAGALIAARRAGNGSGRQW